MSDAKPTGWRAALVERLSRETSSGRFVPEIDGLRFVAVIGVMLYHLGGYLDLRHGERYGGTPPLVGAVDRAVRDVAGVGDIGVQLFFGISGFILALPFAEADLAGRPRPSLRRYFVRRLTRLEPPYIINLLIWYPAQVLLKGGSAIGLLPHLAASMFYVHNFVYAERSRINQVAWTLEMEVQFYLLAPLLTCVYKIHSTVVRRGLLLAAVLAIPLLQWPLMYNDYPRISMSILGNLQYFLIGFVLVDLYLVTWRKQPTTNGWWDAIGLLAWAGLLAAMLQFQSMIRASTAPLILLAYMAAFRGRIWRGLFRWTPLVLIGGMCYTIYLYHWIGFFTIGAVTMKLYSAALPYWANYLVQCAVLFPPTIAACAVAFVLFEKPFMRRDWVERFLGRLRRGRPDSSRLPPPDRVVG